MLFLLCATSFTDSAGEPHACPFSRVGSVQLIRAEHFAFGMLSIAETRAYNRAICFPQKAVQTAALGSLGCARQAMNW